MVNFVMDAVAGARRTPGRHKTGGVTPKPPATFLLSLCGPHCSRTSVHPTRGVAASFLTRCRGSRISRPCRRGDIGFVSRHKPAVQRVGSSELPGGCTSHRDGFTDVLGVAASFVLTVAVAATCISEKLRLSLCLLLWQQQSTTAKTLRRPLCCRGIGSRHHGVIAHQHWLSRAHGKFEVVDFCFRCPACLVLEHIWCSVFVHIFLVHRWWSSDGLMNLVGDGMTVPESTVYTCSQGLITCLILGCSSKLDGIRPSVLDRTS